MEQLQEKSKEFREIAIACEVDANEMLDEIADSMEVANKQLTGQLPFQGDTGSWWAMWWVTFSKEWSLKCFVRWLGKCEDSKDYQRMQSLWLHSFEHLWVVGCDIARIIQLNNMRKGVSTFISHRSKPVPESDERKLGQWLDSFDEAALKVIDLFRQKQRRAIPKILEETKQYDEDSLLGKLTRLMSE